MEAFRKLLGRLAPNDEDVSIEQSSLAILRNVESDFHELVYESAHCGYRLPYPLVNHVFNELQNIIRRQIAEEGLPDVTNSILSEFCLACYRGTNDTERKILDPLYVDALAIEHLNDKYHGWSKSHKRLVYPGAFYGAGSKAFALINMHGGRIATANILHKAINYAKFTTQMKKYIDKRIQS